MVAASGGPAYDPADFWALYDEALPKIYGYLVRRTNRTVAEDLTQEVFTTAARTLAAGDAAPITMAWLFTVARSRLFDHLRTEARAERKRALAWINRPVTPNDLEDALAQRRLGQATEAALASLPEAQRAALVLHHLDDLSVADVAARLGKSVRATESLLARARNTFRAALEEADHD